MRPSPNRATIAHLVDEGCSVVEIARRLHINDRAVRRTVAQYRERGHHLPLPKSGRPRTVNVPRIRKVIKKRIACNDEVSMNQITSDFHISRTSVQNLVKCKLDLHSCRLFQGQMLSEAMKENRLEKCQKILTTVCAGRLSDIIWTDEKIATVEVAHNSQNQRQLPPRTEKNQKTTSKNQESVLEVGDGMGRNNIGRQNILVFVDKKIKSTRKLIGMLF
uniref:Paired domain-containing protein n=1 Tax=Haemonchus contortus TaxID=6289 RepID=A0A7I4YUV8_HAECO